MNFQKKPKAKDVYEFLIQLGYNRVRLEDATKLVKIYENIRKMRGLSRWYISTVLMCCDPQMIVVLTQNGTCLPANLV